MLCLIRHAVYTSLSGGYEMGDHKPRLRECVALYHTFESAHRDTDEDVVRIDEAMPFSADQIKDWREQAKELAK